MTYKELEEKVNTLESYISNIDNNTKKYYEDVNDSIKDINNSIKKINARNEERNFISLNTINSKIISGTTSASIGTEVAFRHYMTRTPSIVILISKDNGYIYESTKADDDYIYVKGSASSIDFNALCII